MGLLTLEQQKEMALAHRRVFSAVCDEKNCEKLIPAGTLYVVLKYLRRKTIDFSGRLVNQRVPKIVRCMNCDALAHGREPGESRVKVKMRGRKTCKLSHEEASKLQINPLVKRATLNLLKEDARLTSQELMFKLRKKKALREIKKPEINATLRSLRKLKVIKRRASLYMLWETKNVSA